MMLVSVDGRATTPECVGWPAMNFGQFRSDGPLGTYALAIPRDTFVERLQPVYAKCVRELQADDIHDPDGAPHLREIGYPPLIAVLDHPRQLAELVAIFLYEDVFEAFLPFPSDQVLFVINSVDTVRATGSTVNIDGRGYHRCR